MNTKTKRRAGILALALILPLFAIAAKISLMISTTTINNEDLVPVIHEGTNAQISIEALAVNLATNSAIATNFLPQIRTNLIVGTGGALTNFVLSAAATNSENLIAVKTNVSIRLIAGTDPSIPQYWTLIATNLSGSDWLIQFSPDTNRFRFSGVYGTNAPNTLSNGTAFVANGRAQGTNNRVSYTYFAAP